jgi:hypothetical protein
VPDDLGLIELAAAQHHLVTLDDVRRVGVSEHRWRAMRAAGWWVPVSPTHYRHVATTVTFELQLRAGLGWLGRNAAAFGTTSLSWMAVDVDQPDEPAFLVP